MDNQPQPTSQACNPSSTAALDVPAKVLRQITAAETLAVLSAIGSLFMFLHFLSNRGLSSLFTIWYLLDTLLTLGLAYGIRRKNQACALAMLFYFLFDKSLQYHIGFLASPKPFHLVFYSACLLAYACGVHGTHAYHKLTKAPPMPR